MMKKNAAIYVRISKRGDRKNFYIEIKNGWQYCLLQQN